MSSILSSILIFSNVLLATAVFVVLARPHTGARWVQRIMNPKKAHWDSEFEADELESHSKMASRIAWIGLLVLGGWSFAVGSYLAIAKM